MRLLVVFLFVIAASDKMHPVRTVPSGSGFLAAGIAHTDGTHDVFINDGRQLDHAHDYFQSIEEHGFSLVQGVPTSISREDFSRHFVYKSVKNMAQIFTFEGGKAVPHSLGPLEFSPGGLEPTSLDESKQMVACYQYETAYAVKQAFPLAEMVVAYNQVLRSTRVSTTPGANTSNQASTTSNQVGQAHVIASKIVDQYRSWQLFPESSREVVKTLLQQDEDGSAFLSAVITYHSRTEPYANMPGASCELQAEVQEILSSPKCNLVGLLKNDLANPSSEPEVKSADNGSFEHPAVNGIHSDITESFAMTTLQHYQLPLLGKHYTFRAKKYAVYHLNLWRNINHQEEIHDYHLAVLDKTSLAKEDAQRRELKFDGYTIEQYVLKYNCTQQWVYFPRMKVDEILMFVQSKCFMDKIDERERAGGAPPMWKLSLNDDKCVQSVLHTAVRDPQAPADTHRESCENRFLVFVPLPDKPDARL